MPGYSKGKSLCSSLRMGTNKLRIEQGRYLNEDENERLCRCCNRGAVENELHFVAQCNCYDIERHAFKIMFRKVLEETECSECLAQYLCAADDDQGWMRIALGDFSFLPLEYRVGGIANDYIFELHKIQLEYLLTIDRARDKRMDSLGLTSVGKPYEKEVVSLVETTDDEDKIGYSGSTRYK